MSMCIINTGQEPLTFILLSSRSSQTIAELLHSQCNSFAVNRKKVATSLTARGRYFFVLKAE